MKTFLATVGGLVVLVVVGLFWIGFLADRGVIKDAFDAGIAIGLMIATVSGIWVCRDAYRRDMAGLVWGFLTFSAFLIFLPIYLFVRKPLK